MAVKHFDQHLLAGGVELGRGTGRFVGHPQFFVKYLPQLLGGGDVELLSRQLINLYPHFNDLLSKLYRIFPQGGRVEHDPFGLHRCQHRHQRDLDLFEYLAQSSLIEHRVKDFLQLQGDIGVFAGIFRQSLRGYRAHAELVFPFFADELLDMDGFIIEIGFCQVVHVVPHIGLNQVMGQHGVEQLPFDFHLVPLQDGDVVFQVLTGFGNVFIFQERLELPDDLQAFLVIFRKVHEEGFAGLEAERNADQFRVVRIDPCGFGVEAEGIFLPEPFDECGPFIRGVDQVVLNLVIVEGLHPGRGFLVPGSWFLVPGS